MSRKRLLFLGIIILLIIFLPRYSRYQELRARNKSLLADIERLKVENEELARQIDRLENDPFYIEKKARDKMGIGKKGEIRYRVIYENKNSE